MQAKCGQCKAAESVRGAGGVAEARAGGGQGARAAHLAFISSTCPASNNEEEGDVGPSSAGPQQKLGPGSSSALASTQPICPCTGCSCYSHSFGSSSSREH